MHSGWVSFSSVSGPARSRATRAGPVVWSAELAHADLHWFVPIARPKAGESGKQVEEAADLLAAEMAERRKHPLYSPADGMALHPIASVRLLQQQAGLTAVEGGWRVFIIGDAERLVPQESSQEAANAMLKLLEEPPQRSVFVLTAVDARQLLPTMRSRTAPVRLNRLSDAEVRRFLVAQRPDLAAPEVDRRVAAAAGSIGAAVAADEDSGKARRAASSCWRPYWPARGRPSSGRSSRRRSRREASSRPCSTRWPMRSVRPRENR